MKKLFKSIMVASLCFLLTGCVKMNMDVEIKEDKTANIATTIKISESLLGMSGDEIDLNDEEYKEIKEAGAELSVEELEGESWLVIKTKSENVNLEKSLEIKDNTMYLDINKLSEEKAISDTTNKIMGEDSSTEDSEESTESSGLSSISGGMASDELLDQYASMMDIQYRITMPNEPTAKIGKVEGNTVTLDTKDLLKLEEDGELAIISCELTKAFYTEPWFLSIFGFILGGALALIVVSRIKPKKTL